MVGVIDSNYSPLNFIANNSRFLILPDWHYPNLGSKVLSLCQQRINTDWQAHFGKTLLLLDTFVDPTHIHGTVYRAANWNCVGQTQGYRRAREGYSADDQAPKLVFVRPLQQDAQAQLAHLILAPSILTSKAKNDAYRRTDEIVTGLLVC